MNPIGSDHYWGDWVGQDGITGGYYYIPIDFQRAYNNGGRYAWLKACDGLARTRFFRNAYADAVNVYGKNVGAYAWLDAGNIADPKRQAEFWYSELGNEMPISIDFERYLDNIPEAKDLWAAGYRLRELGFVNKLIAYSNWSYWLEHANSDPAWLEIFDGVWLADPDSPVPTAPLWAPADKYKKAPSPFMDYLFHQYSWRGDPAFWGVMNGKLAIDENRFNGTEEQLADFFGGVVTPPPPTGDTMKYRITITWDAGSNVRSVPSAVGTATIIRTLKDNAVVESADEPIVNSEGTWYKISDGYICTTYYGSVRAIVELISQPPTALPVIHVHLEAEGYPAFDGDWTPNAS